MIRISGQVFTPKQAAAQMVQPHTYAIDRSLAPGGSCSGAFGVEPDEITEKERLAIMVHVDKYAERINRLLGID